MPTPAWTAILPAAGTGQRFGGPTPKQFLEIDGKPIFIRTVSTILTVPGIAGIVLAVSPEHLERMAQLVQEFIPNDIGIPIDIVEGREERYLTIQQALHHTTAHHAEIVVVHDAVRPLASPRLFEAVVKGAEDYGACVPALPIPDTVKTVDHSGIITSTLDRQQLRRIQTPQAFRRTLIDAAYRTLEADVLPTDDASVIERAGGHVHTVLGEEMNLKITTPVDLAVAEYLLRTLLRE